jgi:hypothetical protein
MKFSLKMVTLRVNLWQSKLFGSLCASTRTSYEFNSKEAFPKLRILFLMKNSEGKFPVENDHYCSNFIVK